MSKLIDLLAEQRFFENAIDVVHASPPADAEQAPDPSKSHIVLSVFAQQHRTAVGLQERLPLNDEAMKRLQVIAKQLGGEPAAAVRALLTEIESHTEPWVPAGPGPAPAPGPAPGAGLPGAASPPRSPAHSHGDH
jgi:hypothetical protein